MHRPSPHFRRPTQAFARGSAMVETLLALPVVLLLLVAILGFGVATKRLAPLENAARYDAWRRASPGAPGPATEAQLRDAFYPKDVPATLGVLAGDAALSPQVDALLTGALSDDPLALAHDVLARFPRASASQVTVQHASRIPFAAWVGFTAPTSRASARLNGDWRYMEGLRYSGQPWAAYPDGWHPQNEGPRLAASTQSLFMADIDPALASGGVVNEALRDLYTWYPVYVGPNAILNPNVFPAGQPAP